MKAEIKDVYKVAKFHSEVSIELVYPRQHPGKVAVIFNRHPGTARWEQPSWVFDNIEDARSKWVELVEGFKAKDWKLIRRIVTTASGTQVKEFN